MTTSTKIIAAIVIVVAIGTFAYWFEGGKTPEPKAELNNQPSNDISTTPTENKVSSNSYKDGTYSVTEDYMSPGGKDSLGVTVTIGGGKISSVDVKNMAGDKTSSNYQNRFIAGISSVALGQSIDNLKLGVVSGASLATNAFNKALEDIRTQAQVK